MNGAEVLTKFKAEDVNTMSLADKLGDNLEKLGKIGVVAFSAMATAADVFAVKTAKAGIAYNAEMETMNVRLETLTGSAEEAAKVMDQIKKDALSTPFDVSSLVQAESLLISTGLSAEDSRKDILALGNAISAVGGGNDELQRMAVNMQQIKNVGKASSLDIKQFAYAGIDVYGLLADSMGITREEAAKMDVTYEDLSKALNKASSEGGKYYKAMEKQSKTYAGATSNLKESIAVLKGELAQGLFEAIKDLIPKLTELFDWLGKNKELVMALVVPILTFINTIVGMMIVGKVGAMILAFYAAVKLHPFTFVVAAIAALVAAFIYLWNHCEAFRNFWIGLWESIKTTFQSAWLFIVDMIDNVKIAFNSMKGFVDGFKNHWNNFCNGITSAFEGVGSIITSIWEGIKNGFKTAINWIIDKFNWFIRQVNKIKFPDWDWLGDLAGKGFNFKELQRLATGTNYVPQDMPAFLHEGEAVIPKKFNPYANNISPSLLGTMNKESNVIVNVENNMEFDTLGQLVNNIKTFSGGAKNDYNYGMGG